MLKSLDTADKNKLIQLEQMIIHLKSELAQYKDKVQEYEAMASIQQKKLLQEENSRLLSDLENIQQYIQHMEKEKATLAERIIALEEEKKTNTKLQATIDFLQNKLQDYESAQKNQPVTEEYYTLLDENFQKLENKVSTIISQLSPFHTHTHQLETIQSDFEKLSHAINGYFDHENVIHQKLDRLREQYDQETEKLITTISTLTDKETKLTTQLEQTEQLLSNEQHNNKSYLQQIDELKSTNTQLTNEIEQLKQSADANVKNEEQHLLKISDLQETVDRLIMEMEKLTESSASYTLKEKKYTEEIDALKEKVYTLSSKESGTLQTKNNLKQPTNLTQKNTGYSSNKKSGNSFQFKSPNSSNTQQYVQSNNTINLGKGISQHINSTDLLNDFFSTQKKTDSPVYSLGVFYEKNPLFNNPGAHQNKINPFKKK